MAVGKIGYHLAPTLKRPKEFALFFIPADLVPAIESLFADLDESEAFFLLVPTMRIEQLSWRPDRIKRADVRQLTHQDAGVWVALKRGPHSATLRSLLRKGGSINDRL